uniref:Uncharacterized protein n=1 Tax=Arundo donax TaxID=35708 RepID=A0A0A9FEM9_ARUDO
MNRLVNAQRCQVALLHVRSICNRTALCYR